MDHAVNVEVGGQDQVYSVGAFNRTAYKVGVAYSDTFLPRHGATHRRILTTDTAGVWGGHAEVRYLLQSEKPAWPNYAADAVQAPGVGWIVPTGNTWSLFFAGYDPSEHPQGPKHTFIASHRRTFFLPLEVTCPQTGRSRKRPITSWRRGSNRAHDRAWSRISPKARRVAASGTAGGGAKPPTDGCDAAPPGSA